MGTFINKLTEEEYKEKEFTMGNTPSVTLTSDNHRCNYDKKIAVLLIDKQHNLYTGAEWEATGRLNSELIEGVVLRGRKGYLVLTKETTGQPLCASPDAIPSIPQYDDEDDAKLIYGGNELYDKYEQVRAEGNMVFPALIDVESRQGYSLNFRLPTLAEIIEILQNLDAIDTIANAYSLFPSLLDGDSRLRSMILKDDTDLYAVDYNATDKTYEIVEVDKTTEATTDIDIFPLVAELV